MGQPAPLTHKPGRMSRNESRLALSMVAPTVLVVMLIVLFPLLATFWISFKPIELADLRAPTVRVTESRPKIEGDVITLRYKLRNSAQDKGVQNVTLQDAWTPGLTLLDKDTRCDVTDTAITCDLGNFAPKQAETLIFTAKVGQSYLDQGLNPKDSKPIVEGTAPNALIAEPFTFANFAKIFSLHEFKSVLIVTFAYTFFGTVGALVFGLFAAQILQHQFPGRSIFRGLMLFPYVAPVIAVAYTWIVLLDPFSGSLNALLIQMGAIDKSINFFGVRSVDVEIMGFVLPFPLALSMVILFEVWRYFPLAFLFILARMQSIPQDMYEAADMDGASPMQQFWSLSLPQLVGILSVLFLLRFIWTFNKFDDIFLLTGGNAGTRTLTVQVYEQAFAINNLGTGCAVAVIVFVLLSVFAGLYFWSMPEEEGL